MFSKLIDFKKYSEAGNACFKTLDHDLGPLLKNSLRISISEIYNAYLSITIHVNPSYHGDKFRDLPTQNWSASSVVFNNILSICWTDSI